MISLAEDPCGRRSPSGPGYPRWDGVVHGDVDKTLTEGEENVSQLHTVLESTKTDSRSQYLFYGSM